MVSEVRLVADPYPPYQYLENGKVRGVDHEIISESFGVHKITVQTSLKDWSRCMDEMESGKADGIFQITSTPKRARRFIFSEKLRDAKTVFFKKKGASITIGRKASLDVQLQNYKVGVLSGYSYEPEVDDLKDEMKVEKTGSEDLIEGLLAEEFDLALMDTGVAAHLIKRMKIEDIEKVSEYEITRQLYMAFQKSLPKLAVFFNSGLKKIKEEQIYDGIFRKYGL